MHTSIGAKLFICKLDYCLKVDEPSTNAKKMGYVYVFALNFQYNLRQAKKYCKIRMNLVLMLKKWDTCTYLLLLNSLDISKYYKLLGLTRYYGTATL